ncbi:MAG: sulfurtransferase TusA family protein [Bacillota bacterium]
MKVDASLDLAGVACPINFVMAKLKLEELDPGQVLEVMVDDGAPCRNVPRSLAADGHAVLTVEEADGRWRILVRRGVGPCP